MNNYVNIFCDLQFYRQSTGTRMRGAEHPEVLVIQMVLKGGAQEGVLISGCS